MTDIDWSKAPEGFPIWIESLNSDYVSDWHCEEDRLYRDRDGKVWMKDAVEYGEIVVHSQPAQIAAEGRAQRVAELYDVITGPGDCWAKAARAIDAGYRRVEQ